MLLEYYILFCYISEDITTSWDAKFLRLTYFIAGAKLLQANEAFLLGKYGALVVYEEDPSIKEVPTEEGQESTLTLEDLGKQLCQHVVGMNPTSIGSFDEELKEKPQEEKRLLHQDFMFDDSLSVKDVLKKYGVRVTDFIRIECGEERVEETEPESSKALEQ